MLEDTPWIAAIAAVVLPFTATAQENSNVSARYKALQCPLPSLGSTWAVLERDGANRQVEPYLSSLGQGESGTGVVRSPALTIGAETITFTIRGHDGQTGGCGENYIALVDARKGKTLLKTPPPQTDALKQHSWDVSRFKGMEVRIEIHDGNAGGAFAWLGVGQIDASPGMKVDFRQGIPKNWDRPQRTADARYELLTGGIPFRRNTAAYSVISKTQPTEANRQHTE